MHTAPAIEMPSEVRGRPGRLIVIEANAAGIVRWHACAGPDHIDHWSTPDGKTLIMCTPTPGTYHLLAWTAVEGIPSEGVRCVVIVETEEPPTPADEFVESLRAAWSQEHALDRMRSRDQLAQVYRTAAKDLVGDPRFSTLGELLSSVQKLARETLPVEALSKTRTAISAELRKQLPVDPATPLDGSVRERCRAQFQRVAAALEALR
jgi:hypothetical protein